MNKPQAIAAFAIAAALTGCTTYIHEWRPSDVGNSKVVRSEINENVATRNKYRIQSITVDGADFGSHLYVPEQVAKFMPGVFAEDGIPVTLTQHKQKLSTFSFFAPLGYFSSTAYTPYTLVVHTHPAQTIEFSVAMDMAHKFLILSLIPFSDSSDTPYFYKGWLESPENLPVGKTVSALAKAHVMATALALKRLEDTGMIQ